VSFVTVRHFTEEDIPLRTELLRESHFQANLTDFAASTDDDGLAENQRRTIEEQHRTKRMFTLCGPQKRVMGFAWITSIDWRNQCCELSFGVLPRDRGIGAVAVIAANQYLRLELNMDIIVNQVLDHNKMLLSADSLADQRRVHCDFDSYTVGEWRAAAYWTSTEQDVRDQQEQEAIRRREVADRIRARAQQLS
jgi:hypothetical protein